MSTARTVYQKYVLGFSFLLRQGQGLLLEILNYAHHTSSQYSKEGKTCENGSSSVIPFNPLQARLFYRLKVQELDIKDRPTLMISGTI